MVLLLAGWILAGNVVEVTLIQVLPGLAICFRVDAFGIVFALVSSFLWMVAAAYTVGYMRGVAEHAQTRFSSVLPWPFVRPSEWRFQAIC